jgi:hypothetical protein
LQIYFKTLESHEIKQVEKAFGDHIVDVEHGTFFPKPSDIIRRMQANEPSTEEKGRLSWLAIMGEIRRVGRYGTLNLDDKIALAALKSVGGWNHLCGSMEKDLVWIEKEFMSAYQTFDKTPVEMLPSSLPGLEDIHNAKLNDRGVMANIADKVAQLNQCKSPALIAHEVLND